MGENYQMNVSVTEVEELQLPPMLATGELGVSVVIGGTEKLPTARRERSPAAAPVGLPH